MVRFCLLGFLFFQSTVSFAVRNCNGIFNVTHGQNPYQVFFTRLSDDQSDGLAEINRLNGMQINDSERAEKFWIWFKTFRPTLAKKEESFYLRDVLELSFKLYRDKLKDLASRGDPRQALADITLRVANHCPHSFFRRSKGLMWITTGVIDLDSDLLDFSKKLMEREQSAANVLLKLDEELTDYRIWNGLSLSLTEATKLVEKRRKVPLGAILKMIDGGFGKAHANLRGFRSRLGAVDAELSTLPDLRAAALADGEGLLERVYDTLKQLSPGSQQFLSLDLDRALLTTRLGSIRDLEAKIRLNQQLRIQLSAKVDNWESLFYSTEEMLVPRPNNNEVSKDDDRFRALQVLLKELNPR